MKEGKGACSILLETGSPAGQTWALMLQLPCWSGGVFQATVPLCGTALLPPQSVVFRDPSCLCCGLFQEELGFAKTRVAQDLLTGGDLSFLES